MKKQIPPKVAVLILNWNGLEDTRECLNSFKKVAYPNFGIIVIDNGSAINEAEILAREFKRHFNFFHCIRLEKNLGFCEGNNIGINYAREHIRPDYYLLINNDVIVHPNFLGNLVQALEAHHSAGVVSPKIFCYPDKAKLWWPGVHKLRIGWKVHLETKPSKTTEETDVVTGCCMLIKSNVIKRIGVLIPQFFLSGLDTFEYSLRAKKAGFKLLYVPSSVIWHKYSKAALRLNVVRRFKESLRGGVIFCVLCSPRTHYLLSCILHQVLKFFMERIKDISSIITNKNKRKKFYEIVQWSFCR